MRQMGRVGLCVCISRSEEEGEKERGQGHVYTAEKLAGKEIQYFE